MIKKVAAGVLASSILATGLVTEKADAEVRYIPKTADMMKVMDSNPNYKSSVAQSHYSFMNQFGTNKHDPYEYVGTIESKYYQPMTAFAINKNTIVTVQHGLTDRSIYHRLITDPDDAKLKFTPTRYTASGQKSYGIKSIKRYTPKVGSSDVAVLKLKENLNLQNYAKLPTDASQKQNNTGDYIRSVGYPSYGSATLGHPYYSTGRLLTYMPENKNGESQSRMSFAMPVVGGQSGSPVINPRNEVIGMVTSTYPKGYDFSPYQFASGHSFNYDVLKFINANK